MKTLKPLRWILVVLVLVSSLAQTAPDGDTVPPITNGLAHEDAASAGVRSPGHMVNAGIASAQNAVKQTRTASATITQEATDDEGGFLALVVDYFQTLLLSLLGQFVNMILDSAGFPPFDFGDLINGNTNNNSNSNSNTNSNDNDNGNDNDNENGNDNDNDNGNTNNNSNSNLNSNQNDNTGRGGVRKINR